jgi:putative transposase
MPIKKRPRIAPTDSWQQLELLVEDPEQRAYEVMRTCVLFGQSPAERARQTGVPARSLYRMVERFDQLGMASLFVPANETPRRGPSLSPALRQLIVDRKAEYPAFHLRELAQMCYVKEGRRPSPGTIQRVLADGPPPTRSGRRYPPYREMADPADARYAIVDLHREGWRVSTIAAYLECSRQQVYRTLRRWIAEGVVGLDDKSRAPKRPARKATFGVMLQVRELQQNPLLGEWRMHAALKRMGLSVSPRTCGRIMALNRDLYGVGKTPAQEAAKKEKRTMPFAAQRRHQYWTVDIRYLDTPHLEGKAYCISILENFSRAMLASEVLPAQDLPAFLRVLRAAIHKHGSPEALVSDGGAVFKAKDALRIYATFQIKKERIEKRQAWQSYIETAFSIQRRMADYAFAAATSWPELRAIHERWFADYNYQDHWAHRQRTDGCHSPAEVLGWVHGLYHTEEEIERAFRHRAGRVVNRSGYVRYRHRRVYAERGLIGQPATMWLCGETLTVEHQDEPLSQFAVEFEPDHYHLARVTDPRLFETRFVSPQPFLWYLGDVEWHLVRKAAPYQRRPKPAVAGVQLALFSADV